MRSADEPSCVAHVNNNVHYKLKSIDFETQAK